MSPLQSRQGTGQVGLPEVKQAQVVEGGGAVGVQLGHLLKLLDRLLLVVETQVGDAQVVVGSQISGLQLENTLEFVDGFGIALHSRIDHAQAAVQGGFIGVRVEQSPESFFGRCEFAFLEQAICLLRTLPGSLALQEKSHQKNCQ